MIAIFKNKAVSNDVYSEKNAYFMDSDITEFFDVRTGERVSLSYQRAYQIGKDMYERKFGELEGAELSAIRSNLVQVYRDKNFKEKEDKDLDPSDIGNVITHLGKNAWLTFNCWTHFKKSYRIQFGIPDKIIDSEKLKDFFSEYSAEENPYTKKPTKLIVLNSMKKNIHAYINHLLKDMYDDKRKVWHDFDVVSQFVHIRKLMIDVSDPIPVYAWNLIDGNPFYRLFRVCKNYMLWKNSLMVYKKVFSSVCDWESGSLLLGDEVFSEYEEGLWVNWNRVGKDFLNLKNKIMTLNGGIRWLKGEFADHIQQRAKFYDTFTGENKLIISKNILKSIKKL